jgi:hypothetical protein
MSLSSFIFGSPSQQQSQQQSTSTGVSSGFNSSNSDSSSTSLSSGQSTSTQSIAFDQLFQQLFGNASNAAAQAAGATPALSGDAAQLFSGGLDFLNQLTANPGSDYLTGRVTGPDTAEAAQLDALKSGLGDLFKTQIDPSIVSHGVGAGTFGSARGGVAEGVAAGKIAQQFQQGAATIMSNSQNARDAAAESLNNSSIAGAGTGLGALGSLYGIAANGANAGLAPYLQLAQIMGGPTTLTNSQSTNDASSIARAISSAFGENSSYDTSSSTGTGSATGATEGFGDLLAKLIAATG